MTNGGLKALIGVLLASTAGTGTYAFVNGRQLHRANADTTTKLSDCEKTRGETASQADESSKAAALAAADLKASQNELEELRRQKLETEQRLAVFQSMTEKFRKMIDAGKLKVEIRHGRMVLKLPAGVLFKTASADIEKDGQTALLDVAKILKQFPDRRFEVAGHTDNVPVGPPSVFKNNLELSTARALNVASFLIESGFNPAKLSAAGYSEFQPVASNAHEAGRQENRRIEIVLQPNLSELPPAPAVDGGVDSGAKSTGK
ncbi:MAG: flagellar motor protein MotB [Polyangiaceae bacterium]